MKEMTSFYQPLLYKLIAKQKPKRFYAEKLLSEGVIDAGLVKI
jgi:2-oxoglutarate dehydrogenase complex dehydrogenase (E1) component-like enzyme